MKKGHHKRSKKKRRNGIYLICWKIIPMAVTVLLILDGFGVYSFNTERLLVIGSGMLVLLIPFFSEIKLKDFSIKKGE